jgi:hypothetical protein
MDAKTMLIYPKGMIYDAFFKRVAFEIVVCMVYEKNIKPIKAMKNL